MYAFARHDESLLVIFLRTFSSLEFLALSASAFRNISTNGHFEYFRKVEQDRDSNEPRGVFYFSDIISLQNLLTTLNINKDQTHLTAYNYKDMAKRQWRTSFISPFAANIVAVFYK